MKSFICTETLDDVEQEIAAAIYEALQQHAGVTWDDVRGPSRKKPIALARHHVAFVLLATGMSLPAVGRLLRRDHSTVLASRRAWARHCGWDDPGPTKAQKTKREPFRHPSVIWGGRT